MNMQWTKGGKYHWTSGLYCINAARTGDSTVYLAYKGNELLGRADDAESARKICAEHNKGVAA